MVIDYEPGHKEMFEYYFSQAPRVFVKWKYRVVPQFAWRYFEQKYTVE